MIGYVLLVIAGYLIARGRKAWTRNLLILWLLSFVVTVLLLQGFQNNDWLPEVSTGRWGGLLLTFMLAIVSIVISFPLGVLLALGRRSDLPAVKLFSIFYIEVVRGVPLVTILYMTQIMLPLVFARRISHRQCGARDCGDDVVHGGVHGGECARRLAGNSWRTDRSGEALGLNNASHDVVHRSAASIAVGDPGNGRFVHQSVQGYDARDDCRAVGTARRGAQCLGATRVPGFADRSLRVRRGDLFRL